LVVWEANKYRSNAFSSAYVYNTQTVIIGFHTAKKGDFHEFQQEYRLSVISHLANTDRSFGVHLDGWVGGYPGTPCHSSWNLHFVGTLGQIKCHPAMASWPGG